MTSLPLYTILVTQRNQPRYGAFPSATLDRIPYTFFPSSRLGAAGHPNNLTAVSFDTVAAETLQARVSTAQETALALSTSNNPHPTSTSHGDNPLLAPSIAEVRAESTLSKDVVSPGITASSSNVVGKEKGKAKAIEEEVPMDENLDWGDSDSMDFDREMDAIEVAGSSANHQSKNQPGKSQGGERGDSQCDSKRDVEDLMISLRILTNCILSVAFEESLLADKIDEGADSDEEEDQILADQIDDHSDFDEEEDQNQEASETRATLIPTQVPRFLTSPDGSGHMIFGLVIRTSLAQPGYFDSDNVADLVRKGTKWGHRLVRRAWGLETSAYVLEIYLLDSRARRKPSKWGLKSRVFVDIEYQARTFLQRMKLFSVVIGIGAAALTVSPEGLAELLPPPNPTLPAIAYALRPGAQFLFPANKVTNLQQYSPPRLFQHISTQ